MGDTSDLRSKHLTHTTPLMKSGTLAMDQNNNNKEE